MQPVQPPYHSPRVTVITRDDLRFTIRRAPDPSTGMARHPCNDEEALALAVSRVSAAIHARREHFQRQRLILRERALQAAQQQGLARRAPLPTVCFQTAMLAASQQHSGGDRPRTRSSHPGATGQGI